MRTPLDPANQYLSHCFVESPDMMNLYNGNVITDARGYATVVLPDYFGALNRDFRYQLTPIGQFAQAIIAREVQDNWFIIRTDKPNVKVSWQVTGIRQDVWANAHRIPVEERKTGNDIGSYLHPELYGQPRENAIGFVQRPQEQPEGVAQRRVLPSVATRTDESDVQWFLAAQPKRKKLSDGSAAVLEELTR